MASAAVEAAVKARLEANFSHCPRLYPNENTQPPADAAPFLLVQYPVANDEQISVGAPGANVYREEGTIRFVLAIPRGRGTSPWNGWLDEIRALFRGQKFSGINTWAPTSAVIDDRSDDGNYWSLSSSIPYYFDSLG